MFERLRPTGEQREIEATEARCLALGHKDQPGESEYRVENIAQVNSATTTHIHTHSVRMRESYVVGHGNYLSLSFSLPLALSLSLSLWDKHNLKLSELSNALGLTPQS